MSIRKSDKKYFDITKQRLATSSRLNTYNIFRITETNQFFLNHFKYFEIIRDIKDDNRYFDTHEALEDEWWDNVSYKFYGTSIYWYLICQMNDIINPYEELVPGQKIKVLKKQFMYEIFRDMKEISVL
jgi:hypothetical protein